MSESPYADAILDYLADQEPHTIAEIHAAIGASDGAGITQLLRNLMTTLSLARDPRKLVNHREGRTLFYKIIARNPRNPLPEPVEDNLKMKAMRDPIYKIKDWTQHFENSRSRVVENLRWVSVPNRHDGDGYSIVMEQKNAAELFAAWVLIIQVASKCKVRGTLTRDDGTALTAKSLARKTKAPEQWFVNAFNFFTNKTLWLECEGENTEVTGDRHLPVTCPSPIHDLSAEGRKDRIGEEGKDILASADARPGHGRG